VESILFNAMSIMASTSEAAAEGGGGLATIVPKTADLIPALISFLIVYFLLAKFAWPSITGSLDKRAETIRESLEKADEARLEAERLLGEYQHQLAEARKEAAAVLAQAKSAAEVTRSELVAKAQTEAEEIVVKARQAIQAEKHAAIADLQKSVAELSIAVAGKLIGSELSDEQHLRVVEKYVAEAGSLNAN
jgi:F-type H+-transporting ATPase subunit b